MFDSENKYLICRFADSIVERWDNYNLYKLKYKKKYLVWMLAIGIFVIYCSFDYFTKIKYFLVSTSFYLWRTGTKCLQIEVL